MPDFLIADHGSVVTIAPVSEAARDWIDENVASEPWQWLGGALCIDHRYAATSSKGSPTKASTSPADRFPRPAAPRVLGGRGVAAPSLRQPGDPSWVSINYPNVWSLKNGLERICSDAT
jgi:hypothetical protein